MSTQAGLPAARARAPEGSGGDSPPEPDAKARRYGDETVVLSPVAVTVKTPHGFDE
jgi:hypothetical protein